MSKSHTGVGKRLPKYVVLKKKRGQTPLELLESWKSENLGAYPELQNTALAYAGRLDPMAEGKLLILIGDECKKQSSYSKLDKEYEIEIVLDLKTDTGDVLGLVEYGGKVGSGSKVISRSEIQKALKREIGPHSRKYPIFSSKTVQGKPLFLHALEGTLNSITIPEHIEHFYSIKLLEQKILSRQNLEQAVAEHLSVVPRSDEPSKLLGADFRQDAVRAKWRELFSKVPARDFTILRLRVTCGSGSYMRTLAERIGTSLATTAFALSINRTKIGKVKGFQGFLFWIREY